MSWYKQGTINDTNGSSTVTGVGTKWALNLQVGDGLPINDAPNKPHHIFAGGVL